MGDPMEQDDVAVGTAEVKHPGWPASAAQAAGIPSGLPSQTGMPLRNLPDEATSKWSPHWSEWRAQQRGRIVFAHDTPAKTEGKANCTEFKFGDRIHARAFWPRALRNMPIAKDDQGKPVYGPVVWQDSETVMELSFRMKIDGELVRSAHVAGDGIATFTSQGGLANSIMTAAEYERAIGTKDFKGVNDFWAFNQSINWPIDAPVSYDGSSWEVAPLRCRHHFSKLSPGPHRIDFTLHFRIRPADADEKSDSPVAGHAANAFNTPHSHPIAAGSFILHLPEGPRPLPIPSVLVQRPADLNISEEVALREEKACLDELANMKRWGAREDKPQQPMAVRLWGDWYESEFGQFRVDADTSVRECVQYGKAIIVYLYRDPRNNWEGEYVRVYHLAALTHKKRHPKKHFPPVWGFGKGAKWTVYMDQLAPSDVALIKDRCPKAKRVWRSERVKERK